MQKIVINACFGGFGLSHDAIMRYAEIKGISLFCEQPDEAHGLSLLQYWTKPSSEERTSDDYFYERNLDRDDPALVKVVEEMGENAYGDYAKLRVIEIPDGVEWEIDEYDGYEKVAEKHRTWS